MKNENSMDDLFKTFTGVPLEDKKEIVSFLQTDRGLLIMSRALTLAIKVLDSDHFDQLDPLIIKDVASMKVMLRVVTSFLFPQSEWVKDETLAETLQQAFPDINLSEWKL
jgi:hypothetical protein